MDSAMIDAIFLVNLDRASGWVVATGFSAVGAYQNAGDGDRWVKPDAVVRIAAPVEAGVLLEERHPNRLAHLSPAQFMKVFRQVTGMTF